MRFPFTCFRLTIGCALLLAIPILAQHSSTEVSPEASTATVAHVYVQTSTGVNVYDATAAGKLTLVKGSPFKTSGQMEGINGKYLLSVGTDDIHAYAIESNGAVGKQAAEVNTQDYDGAECGNTTGNGAILDHTGKHLYVQLFGATYDGGANLLCAAWQSYKIESNGELTFIGDLYYSNWSSGSAIDSTVPTISSNDKFAYGVFGSPYANLFSTFVIDNNGVLDVNQNFNEVDPTPDPAPAGSYNNYFPFDGAAATDPTGHLAVVMTESFTTAYPPPPPQIASYTINDTTGAIDSTNTWADMPTPDVYPGIIRMSTSGKLLAVAGTEYGGTGLQIFHFNGANPITPFSSLLPAVYVDQLGWDNNNHLYALSYSAEELYVYTVTPTNISEVAGSPFHVANAYGIRGLIVVPKL